jgi:inositol transporter-like SP family MFS transporter
MNNDKPWRDTILAGLANYIDSGSIVAGSAALALWADQYNMSTLMTGLIAAFSANAISAGVGSLIGGMLCDKYGRKKIYQYDMLFYAFGMLWMIFATGPWMVFAGFVMVGLAVGADIPASWSLIAEIAPKRERGKFSGVAQMLWYLGPVLVLSAAYFLEPYGMLGVQIIFGHLFVIAIALTFMRSKMHESKYWEEANLQEQQHPELKAQAHWSNLLQPKYLKSILFLAGMYGFWNLWAGVNGFFFPYIMKTVGGQTQAASLLFNVLNFGLGIVSIFFIFMRYSDKVSQRKMFLVSAMMHVVGMSLLALFPLTTFVALSHVLIMAVAQGFGAQSFFQLWSAELFPTMLRSTAQGLTFAIVRIFLGVFSFFVPWLTATGFTTLAWILVGFLAMSALIGFWAAPNNAGKTLEEIEAERA